MKPLQLNKNNYGLRVYCTKCKKLYNYDTLKTCKDAQHQHFKSAVKFAGKTWTKMYNSRDFDEVLSLAITFKTNVRKGFVDNRTNKNLTDVNSLSILESAELYMRFQNDFELQPHLKKGLTEKHLKQCQFHIEQFLKILKRNGVNIHLTPIRELNDFHVGCWYTYITNNYARGSWVTILRIVSAWINYLNKDLQINILNPFSRVQFPKVKSKVTALNKEQFEGVLNAIKKANPIEELGKCDENKVRKNRFRPYLENAFKFALYTGLRREEVVMAKWSDIMYSKKTGQLVLMARNLKVERQRNADYDPKYVPVHDDLLGLLYEIGFEENKGKNKFIIAPQRGSNPMTVMLTLTKGFTHYYKPFQGKNQ